MAFFWYVNCIQGLKTNLLENTMQISEDYGMSTKELK